VQRDGQPDGERPAAESPGREDTAVPVIDGPAGAGLPPTAGLPMQEMFAYGPQPGPYPPPGPVPSPHPGGLPPLPVRTHRWGLGAYLLAEAVFLLVSAGLAYLIRELGDPTAGARALMVVLPAVLAAGTALLITWVRGNGPRIDLGLEWSWRDVWLGVAFGVSGLVLTIPASLVYIAIVGPDATSAVGEVFGDLRSGPLLAVVVLLAVAFIGPACEEILYRGMLWGGVEKLAGRWAAFGVSTLLFALAHFEFERTPLLIVVTIPIALARLYTGRLLASIVAHQINNLLPGIMLALGLLGVVPLT
jgi:uncharacterized protein